MGLFGKALLIFFGAVFALALYTVIRIRVDDWLERRRERRLLCTVD